MQKNIPAPAGSEKLEEVATRLLTMANSIRSGAVLTKQMSVYVKDIRRCAAQLSDTADVLDPIAQPAETIDPNDPKFQAVVLALRLVHCAKHSLADMVPFYGSGVYALYYKGPFLPYSPISGTETPIYVGKADPNSVSVDPIEQGLRLHARLIEHRKNFAKVNFEAQDFEYRYLPLGDGSQVTVEKVLIQFFRPLWNNEGGGLSGFGKHGDRAATRGNKRSPWDTLHPGRKWAEKSEPGKSHNEILTDVAEHFEQQAIYLTTAQIVEQLRF